MTEGAIANLHTSSCETVGKALRGLASIKQRLNTLTESQARLLDSSHFLRPIYLTGKIEMAEGSGSKLATVFEQVGGQLKEIGTNLSELKTLLEDLGVHLVRGLARGEQVEAAIAQIDSQMNVLTLSV